MLSVENQEVIEMTLMQIYLEKIYFFITQYHFRYEIVSEKQKFRIL